ASRIEAICPTAKKLPARSHLIFAEMRRHADGTPPALTLVSRHSTFSQIRQEIVLRLFHYLESMKRVSQNAECVVPLDALVGHSGRPETLTVWMAAGRHEELQEAIHDNRVLTFWPGRHGDGDRGQIGFHPECGAMFLIFPNRLPLPAGCGVHGIRAAAPSSERSGAPRDLHASTPTA